MPLPRAHRAKLLLAVMLAAALGGGWLWLRDSSLVAVQNVTVIGLSGDSAPAIRSSLEQTARSMSTLHLRLDRLRTAVSAYTVVKDLKVQTDFPHGLRIDVIEQLPVAALAVDGRRVPVAGNGLVVSGVPAPAAAPTLSVDHLPSSTHVTDRATLTQLAVIDAAPSKLRDRVSRISVGSRGLTVELRDGPPLYFGDTWRVHAKWDAAVRVLADPSAHGATYIDVRIPERPTAQVGDPATSGSAAQTPGAVSGAGSATLSPANAAP
jgi:cell division protein FtsQ